MALALIATEARAATPKTPAARLKRVNQSLEAVAGRTRSSRGLTATAETAAGALVTYTGVGLLIGAVKFGKDPARPTTGSFNVDLGHAFVDAYTKTPGMILGIAVGGMLTATGVGLLTSGIQGLFGPYHAERVYDSFAPRPAGTDAEIQAKAELGELYLKDWANMARRNRQLYGWTGLICGGLILIAATATPEEPAPFFMGGVSGVYGLVSLLTESPTEEEYASYEAWKSGAPLETAGKGFRLAAMPAPGAMGMAVSFGF
ncbi:MAG TPA: hypothetical protein VM598_05525 [Bdellovibrionota bacterium]|nr:hypothetical protein [Bdellovibrionota bacterium]